MTQNPEQCAAAAGGALSTQARKRGKGSGSGLLIAAVGLAVLGLLALGAVLLLAVLGAEAWPGFVLGAYIFLPLGFLLMIISVLLSIRNRGRA